jgi:transcriptional regulator with XRE-family HTH domain
MNEQQALSSGSPDNTGTYELTPGAYLRESREAAGLHLATLAASLKVSVRKLEALEHDQFDLLPDAVFTRALASSVCRMLKLEPAPVLERLPPNRIGESMSLFGREMWVRQLRYGAKCLDRPYLPVWSCCWARWC